MKLKNLLLMVACFMATGLSAQVAIGGGEPAEGSILDLSGATNLGLLLPRVIALPTGNPDLDKAGMMVYNTTDKKVYTYDASVPAWVAGAVQADLSGSVSKSALRTINGNTLYDGEDIVIPDGAQGPAGPQGDPGAPGANGDKGDTGAVGPQGPAWTELATTSAAGLMSAEDKAKLDALTTGTGITCTDLKKLGPSTTFAGHAMTCENSGTGWRMATVEEAMNGVASSQPVLLTLVGNETYYTKSVSHWSPTNGVKHAYVERIESSGIVTVSIGTWSGYADSVSRYVICAK